MIHSADPRVLQWPVVVNDTLQRASTFVMEMTPEADTSFKRGRAIMKGNGTGLEERNETK